MSNDPSPLKYMGTQSQETVAMEAIMAREAARATEQAADRTAETLADELHKASSSVADAGSTISNAASWAVDKAKDTAQAAAGQVRKRTTKALEGYTRDDPVRAILIAAGTGALLMVLVALMLRSGAGSVTRRVRANT
jgi:ElaB/YqjD/DUF883 family membrane-anchored ribosome-binding protein